MGAPAVYWVIRQRTGSPGPWFPVAQRPRTTPGHALFDYLILRHVRSPRWLHTVWLMTAVRRSELGCWLVVVVAGAVLVGCGSTSSGAPAKKPTKPLTFSQVIDQIRSGIVRMEVDTCGGTDIGTGFLVGNRLVATVEHVVAGAQTITLKQNGKVVAHGTVIGSDTARDLALVRTDRPLPGHHFVLAVRTPQLGDDVAAIGFPLALPLTVTRGSVSGTDRTIPIDGVKRRSLIQTDAAVNPGNSGGPLITDIGTVVGLVDLGTNQANGLAFAVSSAVASPLIRAWAIAPQPTTASACPSPAPTQTQAAPPSTTAQPTYNAPDFSIDYPPGWVVTHIPESGGNVDNTFKPSGVDGLLLRVDENAAPSVSTPNAAAAPVIAGLRRDPTYTEVSLTDETFDGVPSLRWEFEVDEGGVRLHKVDEFFIDSSGRGWGVLIESPQAAWSQLGAPLQTYANTFVSN